MRYSKGLPAKRRIRKQVTDSKDRIIKISHVMTTNHFKIDKKGFVQDYWSTFRYDLLAYMVGIAITLIILATGRWHWERYQMDGVTFGLGYVKWETGEFPNYRGIIIQYEENIK